MVVQPTDEGLEKRRSLIRKIRELPTVSTILTKLVELVMSEKSCARDLARLIEQDIALHSAILKIVNSAFYGHRREISSLRQATVILGFNMVRNVALGVSVFKSRRRRSSSTFNREALWYHSLGAGSVAKITARITGYKDPEQAFVAGLLHDAGKVIFDEFFADDFSKVIDTVQREKCSISVAEREIMGIDHGEAGFILLEQWNLPSLITHAVRYHHNPGRASDEFRTLTFITHLADITAKRLNIGSGGDDRIPAPDPEVQDVLNLDQERFEQIFLEAKEKKDSIEAFQLT